MTPAEVQRIKDEITDILQRNAGIAPSQTMGLLPIKSLQGKLYEAHVLATVCENLAIKEGCQLRLVQSGNLRLKQKGGKIQRQYPYFEVYKNNQLFAELFTDIEFTTLSHELNGASSNLINGDYHELDIALLEPNCNDRPSFRDVIAAIECKNTSLKKSIVRELLGFRRELSLLSPPNPTKLPNWIAETNSNPNSIHMLYCSAPSRYINRYVQNCQRFGIFLEHHKM